jgi:hypothetical protein
MRNWTRTARSIIAAAGALAALAAGALAAGALTACSDDAHVNRPDVSGQLALQSVSPANGVTGVSVGMPMAMTFSGPMAGDMERYIVVREGSLTGPAVAGRWSWSGDRRTLTFTPDAPLKARTSYVIHMGGGMRGQDGRSLDYASCAALGGRAVTGGMMGGATGMMGPGWQGADGGYGMIFTFTTA